MTSHYVGLCQNTKTWFTKQILKFRWKKYGEMRWRRDILSKNGCPSDPRYIKYSRFVYCSVTCVYRCFKGRTSNSVTLWYQCDNKWTDYNKWWAFISHIVDSECLEVWRVAVVSVIDECLTGAISRAHSISLGKLPSLPRYHQLWNIAVYTVETWSTLHHSTLATLSFLCII